jgi:hypothetical protein
MRKFAIATHMVLIIAMLLVPAALAQEEEPVEIEFTGVVTAIDLEANTFTVETDLAEIYVVVPPEDFDLTALEIGDLVEVEGVLAEDGTVLASKVVVETEEVEPVEIEFTGVVTAIDLEGNTFTVENEAGEVYVVTPPEGFDLTTLEVGDTVEVEGILAEDGTVMATKVAIVTEEEDEEDVDDDVNFFCREGTEAQHPVGASIAARYDVEYEQVMAWFCDGKFGFGQIMLALQTAQMTGGDADELLARRAGGEGWGQIWISMELIGKPGDANPPGKPEGAGPPAWAGPPDHAGPPEGAGPPDWAGPPDNAGPPDWAGPPDNDGLKPK